MYVCLRMYKFYELHKFIGIRFLYRHVYTILIINSLTLNVEPVQ